MSPAECYGGGGYEHVARQFLTICSLVLDHCPPVDIPYVDQSQRVAEFMGPRTIVPDRPW